LTLYQVLFLDKIPNYAAVDEGVKLAKNYGGPKAAGLVNAVLRRILREK
ncbi:MAG: 16S rRNA (cytosine(967)-C(5))-methyltransferase RsmB, partial [Candidatus Latescibacteria bacterium]|nr:16S rRNA (cytosine(967)-C(5))-methyltransferase RsmB [Candidatus Latescibacterota bacterium]